MGGSVGLSSLLEKTKGDIIMGGKTSPESNRIEVTVVDNVKEDDALLQEEIFGSVALFLRCPDILTRELRPILPILTIDTKEGIAKYISTHENPLALYVFTNSSADSKYSTSSSLPLGVAHPATVFEHTRSGGFVQNDTLVQFLIPGLPFGGHGPSGQGNYQFVLSFRGCEVTDEAV